MLEINNEESEKEFLDYLKDSPKILSIEKSIINTEDYGQILIAENYNYLLEIAKDYCPIKVVLSNNDFDFMMEKLPEVRTLEQKTESVQEGYKNHFIFGKDETEKVVAVEVVENEGKAECLMFLNDRTVKSISYKYWLLAPIKYDNNYERLEGNLAYRWIRFFNTKQEFSEYVRETQRSRDYYIVWNDSEAAMILHGITLFKGLTPKEIPTLFFDIEGYSLERGDRAKVFMISNTFRDGKGNTTKKVFTVDNYGSSVELIQDWCTWVCAMDPFVIVGHNVFGYDFDYMNFICKKNGQELLLGRDGSAVKFGNPKKPSKKRVDGTNDWLYNKAQIFGRHIICTMFLSVNYDIKRSFPSWKLKEIVEFKALEYLELSKKRDLSKEERKKNKDLYDKWSYRGNRQFYDASKIKDNWHIPEERRKIIQYGMDDSDDAANLYDLMIPAFFYLTQSIPKTFQGVNNSASGSQLNAFLVRSYLQEGHSIPKASEFKPFGGGISFGIPGLYKNINRLDVISMYPHIMLQYNIHNKEKDPKNHLIRMVEAFTKERLKNKKLYKQTGDKYFDDLQSAQKIGINSAYGLLGTPGLNFNYFEGADLVTKYGREIIKKTTYWATGRPLEYWYEKGTKKEYDSSIDLIDSDIKVIKTHNYLVSNIDTDGIAIYRNDQKPIPEEELSQILNELNGLMPEKINFESEGNFYKILILKAKNYVLEKEKGKEIIYKGSAIRDPKRAIALKEMVYQIIDLLMNDKRGMIFDTYIKYCIEVMNPSVEIQRWTTKKSITQKVMNGTRSNETKVMDAVEGIEIQEGDKIRVFYGPNDELILEENYNNNHNKQRLLESIYNTVCVFENIIDTSLIPDYSLKKYFPLLEHL